MENLEESAQALLIQLDQFTAGVRQLMAEELPVGAKTEKVARLREEACRHLESLIGQFEQAAQTREKDLMAEMARLRQLRDQVTVVRHGVLPMFTHPMRRE
jgi:hypothetical protein